MCYLSKDHCLLVGVFNEFTNLFLRKWLLDGIGMFKIISTFTYSISKGTFPTALKYAEFTSI